MPPPRAQKARRRKRKPIASQERVLALLAQGYRLVQTNWKRGNDLVCSMRIYPAKLELGAAEEIYPVRRRVVERLESHGIIKCGGAQNGNTWWYHLAAPNGPRGG